MTTQQPQASHSSARSYRNTLPARRSVVWPIRHNLSRDLIRTWVDKYLYPSQGGDLCEAGVCDERAEAANTIGEYEAAALERLVGRQTR